MREKGLTVSDNASGSGTPTKNPRTTGDDMANGNAVRRDAPEPEPPSIRIAPPPPMRAAKRRNLDPEQALHEFALCRILGHSWAHVGRGRPAWTGGVASFVSRCTQCGTTRAKYLTRSGKGYVAPRYDYPEHYNQRGDEKLDREGWAELFINDRLSD